METHKTLTRRTNHDQQGVTILKSQLSNYIKWNAVYSDMEVKPTFDFQGKWDTPVLTV